MTLIWTWQRFADLGVDGVYDMLALRARVFILEQGPYLDPDGIDRQSGQSDQTSSWSQHQQGPVFCCFECGGE